VLAGLGEVSGYEKLAKKSPGISAMTEHQYLLKNELC